MIILLWEKSYGRAENRNDGMAIKIKIIAGAIVHATSINCPSKRNRFVKLLMRSIIIIQVTTVNIIIIIINVWSWK